MLGMVLIAKPPFLFGQETISYETQATYALILLLLASIFIQPNIFVTLRLLKGLLSWKKNHFKLASFKVWILADVHWSTVCTVSGFIGLMECGTASLVMNSFCLPSASLDRFLAAMIGILGFFAQIALVTLTRFESASGSALLRKSFDVVLAFAFQIIIFQDIPGYMKLLGTLLISVTIFTSTFKKIYAQDNSRFARNKILRFLFS